MALEKKLTEFDREIYEWQMSVAGIGEAGQEKLKNATVLISRIGGVGGILAQQLAAAGVGRLILAHAGNLRANDLNRQLLMSYQGIGQSRISLAARRLQEFNPFVEIVPVEENIDDENAENLISQVDVVACCAPVFEERLSMNRQAVRQKTPLVDCAMFELEGQITTVLPGKTPCLACLYPSIPANWKRQFPVLGAVSGTVGCLGAIEIIKIISGMGPTLAGQMLLCDLWNMNFRKVSISRNPKCPECGPLFA